MIQPVAFVNQDTQKAVAPQRLSIWERKMRERLGIQDGHDISASSTETCSNGCTDDCG